MIPFTKTNPIHSKVFQSEDILYLAKFLLGKYLVTQIENKTCASLIVETEAYQAPHDKGSHAYGNKITDRTKIMFGNGGISYIYLCYGIHEMFNVVTGPRDFAHAILIRAVQPISGIEIMKERRNAIEGVALTNGPGKLCQALGINREYSGNKLSDRNNPIWIGDNTSITENEIISGPRVGIAYAEECANWTWRFRIKNNKWTSKPDHVSYPNN